MIAGLTRGQVKKMIDKGLIRYLCSETLEGQGHKNTRDEFKNTVLTSTSSRTLEEADYYKIGSCTNISRLDRAIPQKYSLDKHRILVDYYQKAKAEAGK